MSTTVTGNMIPNFAGYYGVSSGQAQWLTSGATLISGVTIPVTAFLIKRLSNRLYLQISLLSFTAGSLAACFAPTFPLLLICRMAQSVGSGMLLPFAQVVLLKLYPRDQQGIVLAAYSMAAMVSSVIGPTYAGLMMDAVGWQGVFLSLALIGAVLTAGSLIFMQEVTGKKEAALNVPYILLSSGGFAAFVIGVGNLEGGLFRPASGGLMLLGTGLLVWFSVLQLRTKSPLLNLRIFRFASFRICVLLSLCMYLISMGSAMILPIFSKTICGFSDTAYGLATIFGSVLSIIAALVSGKIYDRRGPAGLFTVGMVLYGIYAVLGMQFTRDAAIWQIAAVFACQTVAMSLMNSPATAMALGDLDGQDRVDGSAIYNTLRQISSSLASTLSVLIFSAAGSGVVAVHSVYTYYLLTAVAAAALFCVYARRRHRTAAA